MSESVSVSEILQESEIVSILREGDYKGRIQFFGDYHGYTVVVEQLPFNGIKTGEKWVLRPMFSPNPSIIKCKPLRKYIPGMTETLQEQLSRHTGKHVLLMFWAQSPYALKGGLESFSVSNGRVDLTLSNCRTADQVPEERPGIFSFPNSAVTWRKSGDRLITSSRCGGVEVDITIFNYLDSPEH